MPDKFNLPNISFCSPIKNENHEASFATIDSHSELSSPIFNPELEVTDDFIKLKQIIPPDATHSVIDFGNDAYESCRLQSN